MQVPVLDFGLCDIQFLFVAVCFFEAGSCYEALTDLELIM